MDPSDVERNRGQQAAWYGEPVGDSVRRLTSALELTQGQVATIIGLSAPMLSQLASGQRAKIANPAVLARLQALAALAEDPGLPDLSRAELARRVAAVRDLEPTGLLTTASAPTASGAGAGAVQTLLRAVASAGEVEQAAALLAGPHPGLAEVLRVYGLGRTAEARAHWAAVVDGGSGPGA